MTGTTEADLALRHDPRAAESPPCGESSDDLDHDRLIQLTRLIRRCAPITILCGAGCSTASGIPDYRNNNGDWKQKQPMLHGEFMATPTARRRYWARSMVGWPRFRLARPNPTHTALVELERRGYVDTLITQNVDGLHRSAGQRRVIDLHGRLGEVICTRCGALTPRDVLQQQLTRLNPGFEHWVAHESGSRAATVADGDAMVETGYEDFQLADCIDCGGVLKPNVVFFGEVVPKSRVERAFAAVARSGLLLVVGSSLMVFSGYRFARAAAQQGLPVALINRGQTRADDIARIKIKSDCAGVLDAIVADLPAMR